MSSSDPSAAIVTPAIFWACSTIARPSSLDLRDGAGIEVGQVDPQPAELEAALPLGERGEDVALGWRVVARQLRHLLGHRRAGVEQDEPDDDEREEVGADHDRAAAAGRSRRSRPATSGDMTNASSQARNRIEEDRGEASRRSRASRSSEQEREVRAAEDEEDDEPAALARTDARGAGPVIAYASRRGPMPTASRTSRIVASMIGRTFAAPAASVSSTTAGSAASSRALLAHRPEELDDPLGQQLLRVDAAGPGRPLAVLDLEVVAAEEAVELADVADLGAARDRCA